MDYKDLYPKLDKVLDGISQEVLCQFAKAYAMSNKDMALALVERFWQPDGEDYREIVDACFVAQVRKSVDSPPGMLTEKSSSHGT